MERKSDLWYTVPRVHSTIVLQYLRLREHLEKGNGNILRAQGPEV